MLSTLLSVVLIFLGVNLAAGQPLFRVPFDLGSLELPVGILLCALGGLAAWWFRD